MSPRIAYWTSSFEPDMEAVASEVATLRHCYPRSVVWGLSHRHRILLSHRRGFCLNPRLHLLFRAAVRVLEPAFQINHIFGSLADWFYLRSVRRPTVLTLATQNEPLGTELLGRVDRFVVEYPGAEQALTDLGIGRERIRLIFPPADLNRFSNTPFPERPFTVLFASSPDVASWLEARGVPLLLDAAEIRPKIHFRLLWRPWGDSLPRIRAWIEQRQLTNVELVPGRCADMALQYREAHVTVAPFVRMDRCKPAPNSLIESLASGRPVLTTPGVGLSELVQQWQAGVVSAPEARAIAEGLDRLQAHWTAYSSSARRLAEEWFSTDRFLREYRQIYQELA